MRPHREVRGPERGRSRRIVLVDEFALLRHRLYEEFSDSVDREQALAEEMLEDADDEVVRNVISARSVTVESTPFLGQAVATDPGGCSAALPTARCCTPRR